MMGSDIAFSTGLPGLDRILKGLIQGDNVVWQVSSIEDYIEFVYPLCAQALKQEKKLVYFHFAKHQAILDEQSGAEIYLIDPASSFETFIAEIHRVIREKGLGVFYVFDCLSDLTVDWYSDQMLGNFFMLTCPYLYDLETIAYFSLRRNHHSFHATSAIVKTTQLFLDVYRHKEKLFVRPLKVQQRYSSKMFMLHAWEGDDFLPVTDSLTISEILTSMPWSGVESASTQLDIWNRTFNKAEEILAKQSIGNTTEKDVHEIEHQLMRMILARDTRIFNLISKYFSLSNLLEIGKRMIGTGLIGGKSVGMLLSRAILKKKNKKLADKLEMHDSFFVGSDVFYTFLVENGCWRVLWQQSDLDSIMSNAFMTRRRILMGTFPDHIMKKFADMLDYFGQSPILVRSSSLLEDNFGNAFPGKYESVFCANQGSRHKRLEDFLSAVRTVYASTMSEKAIAYRFNRGILEEDEQMALLVQRVSGSLNQNLFYPHIAGVGYSFNPFVWNDSIKPESGLLRLVFGLGTRAVDRSDDDYTRVIALSAPHKRPEADDEACRFAQRKVDVLDLESNRLVSRDFNEVAQHCSQIPIRLCATEIDNPYSAKNSNQTQQHSYKMLTFDFLLSNTSFANDMREVLKTISDAYEHPVDIEFTTNFISSDEYKINLVQCRPLQIKGGGSMAEPPACIDDNDLILHIHGPVIGNSRFENIDRLIYVVPSVYGLLTQTERYHIARLIGKINNLQNKNNPKKIMLIGPGRWGTSTPSLGVPVSFVEINNVSIICEIVTMRDNLVPDVSLGTHFFSEMVEMDMLYLALFPDQEGNTLNERFFEYSTNVFSQVLPSELKWSHAIKVVDVNKQKNNKELKLNANTLKQEVLCYLE